MTETADIPPPLPMRAPTARKWGHARTTLALILREMSARYGRSPGGYVWAVFEPLGMILFLALGFSLLLRTPPLGNNFLLFYATGYLAYGLFQKNARFVMHALNFSRNLLRYPAVTWIDAVMGRWILNSLTEFLVAFILFAGILAVLDTAVSLIFGPILLGFALASLLGGGIGLINCVVQGVFPVWGTIWGIVTRPLFLGSGVIWLYRDLPTGAQDILWWNPLLHITGLVRSGFYPTYEPHYVSVLYVLGWGMVTTALGLLLLRRYHLEILARR
ncbi:ABC transporter permease [Tropicibacter naphthalenivorans]|uniref:Polysialic acid transport protein KpsM n=1 Tax=Tropicibacter naphthalenivorans TaxID=441103 RepID=A0A0N7M192_9RHOB|nr:ABC transporter permease [Tropicibacter naphthalenivorans]CUH82617.1 Polysialic acid transport protein KpsM [Tropicibacter naphthalenivorans]SMD08886.1 capsular polysaccharide transport system permease protein [Tropicibacter naphthalenivorans]